MELVKKSDQQNVFVRIKGDWNDSDHLIKIEHYADEEELKSALYFYVFLNDFYNHYEEIEKLGRLDIRTDVEDAVQIYLEQIKQVEVSYEQIDCIRDWIFDSVPVESSSGTAIWKIVDIEFHINGTQFELNYDKTEIDDCIKILLKYSDD